MVTFGLAALAALLAPQEPQAPAPFEIIDLPQPDDVVLEVGGILARGDDLLVSTRRGEVWSIEDAYSTQPRYRLFAEGLQEPLGLLEHDGWIYVAQRGELSRMRDADGDGRMDRLETVSDAWAISGNYHEYCFGPTLAPDGSLWLTLNKPFGPEPFGPVDWRGWAVRITADGAFEPVSAGLRSPAGIGTSPAGEIFYSDNQGEWCASGKFALLEVGDFHGHPHGIESCRLPQSLVAYPGEIPSGLRMAEAAATIPDFKLPAVWIPYDRLGRSPSGFVWVTDGRFGPYEGQVLMADQYSSEVFRLSLQKVAGRWQGACYPLQKGFKCGITRVAWGTDGSLWCGMTNRGWPSIGPAKHGLQRLRWTGATPFELVEVEATRLGFRLRYSAPVDAASVTPDAFRLQRWTYDHHKAYGCPERDGTALAVGGATLAADRMAIDLVVPDRKATWVHMIEAPGVRAADGRAAEHGVAWYTLNAVPE